MTINFETKDVNNKILLNLVFQAASDAIESIKNVDINDKFAVPTHFGWVNVTYEDNGLPDFQEAGFLSGEKDYSSYISDEIKGKHKPEQINSYIALGNYAVSDREFQEVLFPKQVKPNEIILKFIAHGLANSVVERYMHAFSDQEFTFELCQALYLPLEGRIYQRELEIEVVVPIILLDFELDTFQLTDNAYIVKMTNDMQMGRAQTKYSGMDGIDSGALSGCTHALVLKGWHIVTDHYWTTVSVQIPAIMESIDCFFASIRMVRNVMTGYAQLIQNAVGWASSYKANLPEMSFEFVKSYPQKFQWTNLGKDSRPVISQNEIFEISKVYSFLMQDKHASLGIAVKRINACYLRCSEEDSIIDATIAMEALFGDDDNQEMTHKLAMRMAALSRLDTKQEKSTLDIFNETKKIYKFRSKVVHGRKKDEIDKARFVNQPTGKIPILEIALANLRQAIRVFTENPQFLEPDLIDKTLLLHIEAGK